jgi:hypothetical protein
MLKTLDGHLVIIQPTPQEHRFYKLNAEWLLANAHGRKAIAEDIDRHPEWELHITPTGIQRRT